MKALKALYNKYKREVWVGVVVSLITAAILKFADWFAIVMPSVGITIFDTITNFVYTLAATTSDNFLLRIIFSAGFGFLIGTRGKTIINGFKMYKSAISIEKKSKDLPDEEVEKIVVEAIEETKLAEHDDKEPSIQSIIQDGKKIGKVVILFVATIVFIYLLTMFFVIKPINLADNFEKDIIKITPYVEEQDIKKLESDWVCMRSKSDYDEIYEFIDSVKEEYSLPK